MVDEEIDKDELEFLKKNASEKGNRKDKKGKKEKKKEKKMDEKE
jgi:hypothetical protein